MFEGEGSDGLFNNSEVCPGGGNNAAEVSTLEKEGGRSPGGTLEDRDRQTFFFSTAFFSSSSSFRLLWQNGRDLSQGGWRK